MPFSMTPTAAQPSSLASLQSQRPQQQTEARAAHPAAASDAAGADVLVSISAAARAAAETTTPHDRAQTGAGQTLPPDADISTNPVSAVGAGTRLDAPVAAEASQPVRAAAQVQPSGSDPAPREPDAATTDRNQAVQLYLENATRPDNQPPPSTIRASA